VRLVIPRIPQWRVVLIQAPNGTETRAGYNGVNASYAESMNWFMQQGRFLSEADINE